MIIIFKIIITSIFIYRSIYQYKLYLYSSNKLVSVYLLSLWLNLIFDILRFFSCKYFSKMQTLVITLCVIMCAVDNIPVFYLYWTGLLPNIFLYQHLLEIFMILKGCWDQLKSVERLHDLKASRENLMALNDLQCPICLDEIEINSNSNTNISQDKDGGDHAAHGDANGSSSNNGKAGSLDAAVLDCKHVFHYSCLSHQIEVSFSFDQFGVRVPGKCGQINSKSKTKCPICQREIKKFKNENKDHKTSKNSDVRSNFQYTNESGQNLNVTGNGDYQIQNSNEKVNLNIRSENELSNLISSEDLNT